MVCMGCGRWPEKEKRYKPLVKECTAKYRHQYTKHRSCLLDAAKKVGCCRKGGVIKRKHAGCKCAKKGACKKIKITNHRRCPPRTKRSK